MKIILFITLSFLCVDGFCQAWKKDEKDEFTGTIIKESPWMLARVSATENGFIRVSKYNQQCYLEFKYFSSPSQALVVSRNNPFILILSNEVRVNLVPSGTFVGGLGNGGVGIIGSSAYGIHCKYALGSRDVHELSSAEILKARWYFSDYYIEWGLKSKISKKIIGYYRQLSI